jgi:hypothetical protein
MVRLVSLLGLAILTAATVALVATPKASPHEPRPIPDSPADHCDSHACLNLIRSPTLLYHLGFSRN